MSYYGLSLTDFLRENHPELLADTSFIAARAEMAAETHFQSLRSGSSQIEADDWQTPFFFRVCTFPCTTRW
jgi:hypothetical protein